MRASATAALADLERQRAQALRLREEAEDLQQQRHDRQLDHLRLSQKAEQARDRGAKIAEELEELGGETARETAQQQSAADRLVALQSESASAPLRFRGRADSSRCRFRALDHRREAVQTAQRRFQKSVLVTQYITKINEIKNTIQVLLEERTDSDGLGKPDPGAGRVG
jgi:chromosome segregation protein